MSLGQRNPACGSPTALDDGWTTASPESVGLDGARLCTIAARLKETEANVHAVVIVRHGKLVFEQYFAGYDEPWGEDGGQHEFDATTKHDMRSASKSVISLLVGIAIDRKLIASADEPVVKFFPEYAALKSPGWDQITLRHLLTMSSGMQWDENRGWNDPKNDEPHLGIRSRSDPLRPVEADRRAAGHGVDLQWRRDRPARQHPRARVGQVAGSVRARSAVRSRSASPIWNGRTIRRTERSPPPPASAFGRAMPRKSASSCSNKGAWNGKQIVSPEWIEQSVRPRFQAIGYFSGLFFYGQQWWLGRSISGDKEVKWIAAMGLGRPAHLHRARTRSGRDDDLRPVFPAAPGRRRARYAHQFHHSIRPRQKHAIIKPGKNMSLKFTVGDLTIHRIIEQETTFLPALEMLPGLTPELLAENRAWMQKAGALDDKDVLILCFQSYVVKTPHHTILIDSCIGNDKPRPLRPKWNMKTDDTYMRGAGRGRLFASAISTMSCARICMSIMSAGTRGSRTAAGCRPSRRRATCSARPSSITGPSRMPRRRCRRSPTACCRSSRPDRPRSCATITQIGDHARILPTPGHTPGHVAFTFGRGKDDAVFSGDLMHSPLQTRYPELSAKFDVDQAQAAVDAAQFPGALLRHRYAVLHRAFPLAVGRENPPRRQRIFLRGDMSAETPRLRNPLAGSRRRACHHRPAEPAGRLQCAQHPDGQAISCAASRMSRSIPRACAASS